MFSSLLEGIRLSRDQRALTSFSIVHAMVQVCHQAHPGVAFLSERNAHKLRGRTFCQSLFPYFSLSFHAVSPVSINYIDTLFFQ